MRPEASTTVHKSLYINALSPNHCPLNRVRTGPPKHQATPSEILRQPAARRSAAVTWGGTELDRSLGLLRRLGADGASPMALRARPCRIAAARRSRSSARRLARGLALPEHPPGVLRGAPPARRLGLDGPPARECDPRRLPRRVPRPGESPRQAPRRRWPRRTAGRPRPRIGAGVRAADLVPSSPPARGVAAAGRWRVRPGRPHEPGHVDHRRDARGELEDEPDGGRTTRPGRPPERSSRRRPRGRSGGALLTPTAPVLVPPSSFRELPAPWLTMAASAS